MPTWLKNFLLTFLSIIGYASWLEPKVDYGQIESDVCGTVAYVSLIKEAGPRPDDEPAPAPPSPSPDDGSGNESSAKPPAKQSPSTPASAPPAAPAVKPPPKPAAPSQPSLNARQPSRRPILPWRR